MHLLTCSELCIRLYIFSVVRGVFFVAGVVWFLFNNGHAKQPNNNLMKVYIFPMHFGFLKEIFKYQALQFKPLRMMEVERNSTRNHEPTLQHLPP